MSAPPVLHAYARACIRALASAGVRHAVLCPGSRSTPLAVLLDREPRIRVWIHLDERAAAYFGLGIAKARQEPVALLCTSGTAAANFLPAVVEARYGRVPLVVLTADRPPELRDTGAPQAIDQLRLYGTHVKWFCDMPLPEPVPQVIGYAAAAVTRAVATAAAPPAGPVHLNFPFREPLWPEPAAGGAQTDEGEPAVGTLGEAVYGGAAAARPIAALAARLAGVTRGLLICGPQSDPEVAEAAADLAARLGWPVLADPLSQVRCGVHDRSAVIDAYDASLRDPEVAAALAPRLVVRLGGVPTSKTLLSWLASQPGLEQVVIDTAAAWDDPAALAGIRVSAGATEVCRALSAALPTGTARRDWLGTWVAVNAATRAAIDAEVARIERPFEGRIFTELAQMLPGGATLYAGNSMPVRDLDTFFPSVGRPIRFLANRGANGIDGVVSSALGAAAVSEGPLVLVVGDLSFHHDLNGLWAARQHRINASIVLAHNDGGGIFSFLPQAAAAAPDAFERLFGTPHGLDFQGAVAMYGGEFTRAAHWPAFRAALAEGWAQGGLTVVEVRTDRKENVELHRAIWQRAGRAAQHALGRLRG